ncbi:MAG: hypothetical protein L0215_25725 [Gemmataceae bacterium]|nr:hypothetical protein [Gemmataceae bacterium]
MMGCVTGVHRCSRWPVYLASLAALVLAPMLLAQTPIVRLGKTEPRPGDPFPIQRVVISPDRLAAELEKVGTGALVQMPRDDFEALVRRAAATVSARALGPRLVRSFYSAELVGNALVNGAGQWTVHSAAQPGVLPVLGLNLALGKVKTPAGVDGVIGELDGKNLGLFVPNSLPAGGEGAKAGGQPPDKQSFVFGWTLKGQQLPNGLFFDVRVPACPLSILEIKMPAGHYLSVSRNLALVSGPLDTEQADKKLWRLQFTGKSQIDILVRRAGEGQSGLLFTQTQSKVSVLPEKVLADFELNVDVLHTNAASLILELEPSLQPYDVSARNAEIKSWQVKPAVSPTKSKEAKQDAPAATLLIALREPFQGTLQGLRVRCLSERTVNAPWTVPFCRLLGGVERGETLQLSIHPFVPMEEWDAGQFRLAGATIDPDGSQVLILQHASAERTPPRRPSCGFSSQPIHATVAEHTTWSIGPKGSRLQAEFSWHSGIGSSHQLAVHLPQPMKAWQLEDVKIEPNETLRSWSTKGEMLILELSKGLGPQQPIKLNLLLTSVWPQTPGAETTFELPKAVASGTPVRRGSYTIHLDSAWQAQWSAPAGGAKAASAVLTPLTKDVNTQGASSYFMPYRGAAPTGTLRLLPAPARANVRVEQSVTLNSAAELGSLPAPFKMDTPTQPQGHWQARVTIEPAAGAPRYVDLTVWSVSDFDLHHGSSLIKEVRRQHDKEALPTLLALGCRSPLEMAANCGLPQPRQWRVFFQAPLTKTESISFTAPLPALPGRAKNAWTVGFLTPWQPLPVLVPGVELDEIQFAVPLVTAGAAEHFAGMVQLGANVIIQATGLEEAPASAKATAEGGRVFRYGSPGPAPALNVGPRAQRPEAAPFAWADQGVLTTYVESGAPVRQHFRFQLWNWTKTSFSFTLPHGCRQALSAALDGTGLDHWTQENRDDRLRITIPTPADGGRHVFEVVYVSAPGSWLGSLGATVQAAPPALPVPLLTLERVWRLGRGLAPWTTQGFGCDAIGGPTPELRWAWSLGESWLAELGLSTADQLLDARRQTVLTAEMNIRRKLAKDTTLGTALERLAGELAKSQIALVLDAKALDELELRTDSRLALTANRPFWEASNLVLLPLPRVALFTSKAAVGAWQSSLGGTGSLQDCLQAPLAEAAALSRDRSARFLSLAAWQQRGNVLPDAARSLSRLFEGPWTDWRVSSGTEETLTVVRVQFLHGLGVFLALASWAVAALLGSKSHWTGRWRVKIILLCGFGVLWLWLPPPLRPIALWPLGFQLASAAIFLLTPPARTTSQRARTAKKFGKFAVGGSTIWLLCLPGADSSHVQGQGPDAALVYLVAGDAPQTSFALATPELLSKLRDLEGKSPVPPGAVLVAASYQGVLQKETAEFTAQFDIYSFDKKSVAHIPLAGVELKEGAFLDGAPVFPSAAAGSKQGFLVPVQGKGWHRLTLAMSVRPAAKGDYQEMRFFCPKLCQSSVDMTFPASVSAALPLTGLGSATSKKTASGQEWNLSLGREGQIHWRWQTGKVSVAPGALEVREAYYWDLQSNALLLSANLQYTAAKVAVSRVVLTLPEEVEVRTVEAHASAGPASSALPLKQWRVTGKSNERQLVIDFVSPVAGKWNVQLGLVPRIAALAGPIPLRLPVPMQARVSESFLAYRLEGWEIVEKPMNLSVTAIGPEIFSKVWSAAGAVKEPGPITRALSFRRTGAAGGIVLQAAGVSPLVKMDVSWKVHSDFADGAARVQWTTTGEPLALVELSVPANVTLAEVRGAGLKQWSRTGARVQVWLQQPKKQVSLEWTGWVSLPQESGLRRFVLPSVGVRNARVQSMTVQVVAMPGIAIEAEKLQHLSRISLENTWRVDDPAYQGSFHVRSVALRPDLSVLTVAHLRDQQCIVNNYLHCPTDVRNAASLKIVLRNCPKSAVRLDVPRGATATPPNRNGDELSWLVAVSAQAPQPLRFHVQVRLDIDANASRPQGEGLLLPDLVVEGAELVDRWVAIVGREMRVAEQKGLAESAQIPNDLRLWPKEAQRLASEGTVWRVEVPQWRLALQPRLTANPAAAEVFAVEQSCRKRSDGTWLHQADFLLVPKNELDLVATLPAGARLEAVLWNGTPLTPRPLGSARFGLALSSLSGPGQLRLCWRFVDNSEQPGAPNVALPALMGLQGAAVELEMPLAQERRLASAVGVEATTPLWRHVRRARAYEKICRSLNDEARSEDLAALQKGLFWELHQAEIGLESGTWPGLDSQESVKLAAEIQQIRQDNAHWAQAKGWEATRAAAEKQPADFRAPLPFDLYPAGQPSYFVRQAGAETVALRLSSTAFEKEQNIRRGIEAVIVAALALLVVTCFPRGGRWLISLGPELLLTVVVCGFFAWGPSLPGLMLALLCVFVRALTLVRWVGRLATERWLRQQPGNTVQSAP